MKRIKKKGTNELIKYGDKALPPAPKSESLLDIDSAFRLIDLYFKQNNIMFSHLYNSFDKFLDEDVKSLLKDNRNIFFEKITKDTVYRYMFEYENISIKPPTDNEDEIMFPSDARERNMTYASKLVATITQVQEKVDIATGQIKRRVIGQPEYEYPIAIIPVMVKSKYCSTNIKKGQDKSECKYDPGGYFIINGSEKAVMSLERMVNNKPLVFTKKDSNALIYTVQVNSKSYIDAEMTQIVSIRMKKDKIMTIRVPILNEIPVFILFRALGIESDRDIINMVVYDKNDVDMVNLIRVSIDAAVDEDTNIKIRTKEAAINYLINKMRVIKRYNETDKDIRLKERIKHLETLLTNNFLPHVAADPLMKAYYLGYMINRLSQCVLKRIEKDDRDSYVNKRVDLPGTLIFELFKQYYKKMLNECSKFFRRRNNDDERPLNIINQIKPNIIEQGLKGALSTGVWGKKKGVAQMLQRLTYLLTVSTLRRINSPTVDASTNKLTGPRHLHNTQLSAVCVTGDTEILLGNGIDIKQIKDLQEYDTVKTVNPSTLDDSPSRMSRFIKLIPDKLLKLRTISGREIKCTPDHPILVNKNRKFVWIKAGDLKVNDKVIITHVSKYISCDKPTKLKIKSSEIPKQYRIELQKIGILDRNLTQQETEILARLLGASITDGHICQRGDYYDACFSLGELDDVYAMIDDIMKLGFGYPFFRRSITYYHTKHGNTVTHKTWTVGKNGAFACLLHTLGGFKGKKTTQARKLPEWIKKANKRTKREFLSGFQGGDGGKIAMHSNSKTWKLSLGRSSQTSDLENKDQTQLYLESIVDLFLEFGIKAKINSKIIDDKYEFSIRFDQTLDNICKYIDCISYRYCNQKKRESSLPIEYIKYCHQMLQTRKENYNIIEQMYTNGERVCKIRDKTGISTNQIYRIINGLKKGHKFSPVVHKKISYDKFLEEYNLKDNKVSIPIASIEEIKPEPVYDLTTISSNHSFIGNSFVISNCYVETPEGNKVGLVKNLSLMGNVTITRKSQVYIIKSFLKDKLVDLHDISPGEVGTYTRVFLNGEWLGLTKEPGRMYNALKNMKLKGELEAHTSIIHEIKSEIESKEIKIFCDGGRLFRPFFVVKNNTIKLTKQQTETIILDGKSNTTTSANWNEFMIKNQGTIEYLDTDEYVNSMVAMFPVDVENMRKKQVDTAKLITKVKLKDNSSITNRYDDFVYVNYTHCEIHPSMMIGAVVANIPFCNHNQGPRNIYQYSQARHAMGLYASNYRDRLDISYILFHPQRPLITTRMMRYIHTDYLAAGENAVVAIACYSGLMISSCHS